METSGRPVTPTPTKTRSDKYKFHPANNSFTTNGKDVISNTTSTDVVIILKLFIKTYFLRQTRGIYLLA